MLLFISSFLAHGTQFRSLTTYFWYNLYCRENLIFIGHLKDLKTNCYGQKPFTVYKTLRNMFVG